MIIKIYDYQAFHKINWKYNSLLAVDTCTNHAQMHDEMDLDKNMDVQDHEYWKLYYDFK